MVWDVCSSMGQNFLACCSYIYVIYIAFSTFGYSCCLSWEGATVMCNHGSLHHNIYCVYSRDALKQPNALVTIAILKA